MEILEKENVENAKLLKTYNIKSTLLMVRGINVLESKSELEKAMAKQRLAAEQKQKEAEVW